MIDNDKLYDYCIEHSDAHSDLLQKLFRETSIKTLQPRMISGPLQGRLLSFIAKLYAPKNILEIGTFTGYSALCLAEGLQKDGKLITIDINKELAYISEKYFELSPYKNLIQPMYGDAKEILPSLDEVFDMVFIDAKKRDYPVYYDLIIDKMKSGGIILADNILWSGKVLDEKKDKTTQVIHDFNVKLKNDDRVENFILPFRDGINVLRVK